MSVTALNPLKTKAQSSRRQGGFTLLELAIAMTILGMLAAGVLLTLNAWSEHKLRKENLTYMQEVKRALLAYAKVNGVLPPADSDQNGTPDVGYTKGYLPYSVLGVLPKDAWGRQLFYSASRYMTESSYVNERCTALRDFTKIFYVAPYYSFQMKIWDSDPAGTIFYVPAVIVSGGAKDADKSGSIYDNVAYEVYSGSNNPATNSSIFVRFPPNPPTDATRTTFNKFDDMVVYLESPILYATIGCGKSSTPAP